MKLVVMIFAFTLFFSTDSQCQDGRPRIGPVRIDSSAVWCPPDSFKVLLQKNCETLRYPAFQRCFISLMEKLGASTAAVRFTESTDTTGYIRHFKETGAVDIAYVCYPFRANENYGILLVDGKSNSINVDDPRFLGNGEIFKNPMYRRLMKKYPALSVWPGDRFHFDQPRVEQHPDNSKRFIVEYRLQDGCHACERVGVMKLGFDFDASGKLLGVLVIGVNELYLPDQGK